MVLNQKNCALGDGVSRFNNGVHAATARRLLVAALALGAHAAKLKLCDVAVKMAQLSREAETIGTFAR